MPPNPPVPIVFPGPNDAFAANLVDLAAARVDAGNEFIEGSTKRHPILIVPTGRYPARGDEPSGGNFTVDAEEVRCVATGHNRRIVVALTTRGPAEMIEKVNG